MPVPSDARLASIEGKLDIAITRLESSQRLVDAFDDRIVRVEQLSQQQALTSKTLADAAMRLSIARAVSAPSLRLFLTLIFAAIVGGVTAMLAHDAVARQPSTLAP